MKELNHRKGGFLTTAIKSFLLLTILISSLSLRGQNVSIEGNVFDGLSELALDQCKVRLYDSQQKLLGEAKTVKQKEVEEHDGYTTDKRGL